jgi:hypothetical protein
MFTDVDCIDLDMQKVISSAGSDQKVCDLIGTEFATS